MTQPRTEVACRECGSTEWTVEAAEQSTVTYGVDTTRRVFAEQDDREIEQLDTLLWRCMSCNQVPSDTVASLLDDEFMGEGGEVWQLIQDDEWSTHLGLDAVTEKRPEETDSHLAEYKGMHGDCGVNVPHAHDGR